MKRFIQTKFIRTLQEASQTGIEADAAVLEQGYDEFALLLFSQSVAQTDRTACFNSLVYTRAELGGLTPVSGKKCGVCRESHRTHRQAD
jgi:hypothetical protein